ncbi:cysteine desulfurase selenocysteine lyase [Scheffersomyces xylosifermentans]|uniref:cysteine desulfurase selenocysteine lyase n=1 Tax=Scheffersomyces xylosifermentans TaxID=1304137 RepID=UPI00315C5089
MPQPIVPFGKQFREKFFAHIDPKYVPVNHGSYGVTPEPVFNKFKEHILEDFKNSDHYIKVEQPQVYKEALKELAQFFHCDYRNLAIVDNATSGVNTVLRSLPFEKGDKIVIPTTVYGACGNTVKFLENRYGIQPILIQLDYPLEDSEIIGKFEKVFKTESPKLALIDTIISMPGVRFPFEEVTALCHKYGVLSLIDGAHSAGLIPIDLDNLKPDFYTSNLHKWLYVPRGTAVLYVDKKNHRQIHTMPVSHSYLDDKAVVSEEEEDNWLVDRFTFYGTKNFANIAVIKDAIKFRATEAGGEEAIHDYCFDLARKAGDVVSKIWDSPVLENKARDLSNTMVTVEFPNERYNIHIRDLKKNIGPVFEYIFSKMFAENTYVPLVIHNEKLYGRFSAQVYNELSDYKYAAEVVAKVFESLANDPNYKKLIRKEHL